MFDPQWVHIAIAASAVLLILGGLSLAIFLMNVFHDNAIATLKELNEGICKQCLCKIEDEKPKQTYKQRMGLVE